MQFWQRPRSVAPSATDDFEQNRRVQETRNEVVIVWISILCVALTLINASINEYGVRWLPFATPLSLLIFGSSGLIGFILFQCYLTYQRAYWPVRKYVFASFQLIVFVGGTLLYQESLPATVIYSAITVISLASIVLAGLRYHIGVVVFVGLLSCVIYSVIGFAVAETPIVPVVVLVLFSVFFFVLVTLVVAYSVSSLIQLHRDSVWKERLRRFLAPELVQELTHKPELMHQHIERRVATVLFTDIRGFTALSERLQPEEVVAFLNVFLEEMTAAIMEHHGMVDKYIGDSVMGVFGVPLETDQHAEHAVHAAISMQARLEHLNQRLLQRNLPALSLGIGIHTGDLVVGAIGSSHRLDYTVIGDTVNVAARIEGLTRQYDVSLLLSDSTRAMLSTTLQLRAVGTTTVKNRSEPVTVWTPLGKP